MPAGDQRVAQVGRLQERVAPGALGLAALAAPAGRAPRRRGRRTARAPRASQASSGWSRRLEAEHEQRLARPARRRSARPRPGRAGGSSTGGGRDWASARTAAAPSLEAVEQHAGRGLEARALLHAHPGLGDHAEHALRADQHPVRARPGARAGQPAALPDARRRERAHRLDEVVDVRVQRGEVAARAGGDPAAERRVLERLREVAQRQAVLAQLVLEARARWRRPGCGRRARPRRPRARGRAPAGRSSRAGVASGTRGSTPPTTLVPPPNGIAAAPASAHQSSTARARASSRGSGDHVGRVVEAAAEARARVAVGLAVGVRDALVGVAAADLGQRAGGSRRGGGSSTSSSGSGALDLGRRRSRGARERRARPARPPRAEGCWSS